MIAKGEIIDLTRVTGSFRADVMKDVEEFNRRWKLAAAGTLAQRHLLCASAPAANRIQHQGRKFTKPVAMRMGCAAPESLLQRHVTMSIDMTRLLRLQK